MCGVLGAALSILDGWRCRNGHAPAPSDRNRRTMLAKTAAMVARPPPPASFIATVRFPPGMTGLNIAKDERWPAVGSAGRADSKQRAQLRRAVPLNCNSQHNSMQFNFVQCCAMLMLHTDPGPGGHLQRADVEHHPQTAPPRSAGQPYQIGGGTSA